MSSSNVRVQRIMSVLVTLVMIMSLVTPTTSADAKAKALAPRRELTPRTMTSLGTSAPAMQLAERFARPQTEGDLPGGDTSMLVIEKKGGYQIPHGGPRGGAGNGFSLDTEGAVQESRPFTPPSKFITDDPMPDMAFFFEGIAQSSNRTLFGGGFLPPDTNGDASYCYYVQTVNVAITMWDLCDVNVYGGYPKNIVPPMPINVLFSGTGGVCEYTNDGDPIVIYDDQADRWVILQFALYYFPSAPFALCIAVSTSGDPSGSYYLYELDGLTSLPDYPKLGIMDDTYYITVNEFAAGTLGWDGQGIYAFDRSSMLSGGFGPAVFYYHAFDYCTSTEPECYLGGMLPADSEVFGALAGEYGTFIQFDDDAWGYSGDQLQVWRMDVDWGAVSALIWQESNLAVNAFDSEVCTGYTRDCIPQPATTSKLDAISDRLMYRLSYMNSPYLPNESIVVNHTVDMGGYAGIRWYELRETAGTWSIYQQGDHAPDTSNRWMGSMAQDIYGNMALGYSLSSSTIYPTIKYAGRLYTDPLGTLPRTEVAVTSSASAAGSQTSSSHRWGDYSSMSVDITGCYFYYTTEYLRGTTPAEWYTRIGSFVFDSCYYGDNVAPVTTIDTYPSDPSYSHDANFTFSVVDANPTTSQCRLDAGAWSACTSPIGYTGLAVGSHTFEVYSTDAVGNIENPGPSYTWNITLSTMTFRSAGPKDGYVIESTETSNVGGTINSSGGTINVGDASGDKQVKGILSFDTTALPDTAVVVGYWVQVKKSSFTGTNPFTTHGPMFLDILNGSFSGNVNLQAGDFQAPASWYFAASFAGPVANWYTGAGVSTSYSGINLFGPTQLRLFFATDDNDDGGADTVNFISGNNLTASNRPRLTVEYYIP